MLCSCPLDASMSPPHTCFPPGTVLLISQGSGTRDQLRHHFLGTPPLAIPRTEFTALPLLRLSSTHQFIPISPAEHSLGQELGPTHLCPMTAQHSDVFRECVQNNKAQQLCTVCRSQQSGHSRVPRQRGRPLCTGQGEHPQESAGSTAPTYAGPSVPKSFSSVHGQRANPMLSIRGVNNMLTLDWF